MIFATFLLASILSAGPERAVTPPVADAAPYDQWVGSVDTNGNVALTVWNDDGVLAGARIDRDGALLDTRPLVLSAEAPNWETVVRGDGNWLVTWISQSSQVMRRFVNDDGTMSEAVPVVPVISAEELDAAFDGRHFLVAWSTGDSIDAVRLAADGTLVEHSISIRARGRYSSLEVAALSGGGFAVGAIHRLQTEIGGFAGWEDTAEIARLDTNADLGSVAVLERTTTRLLQALRLTADGDTAVAAWVGISATKQNAFSPPSVAPRPACGERDVLSGAKDRVRGCAPGDGPPLIRPSATFSPLAGRRATGLMRWLSECVLLSEAEDLFVAREGQAAHIVASGPYPHALVDVGGTIYVVAVSAVEGTTLLISEDGSERRSIAGKSYAAAAASFGDRIVLTMNDSVGDDSDIAVAVVDAALQDVAARRRLTFAPALQTQPAVARNATGQALAAWVEHGREDGVAVMAARLDSQGRPIGDAFVLAQVQSAWATRPHVASDGSGYLVAWYDGDGKGVRAWRVSHDGTVSGTPSFVPYEGTSSPELCATWTGTEYLLGNVRQLRAGRRQRDVEIRVTPVSAGGVVGETRVAIPEVTWFSDLVCASGEAGTLVAGAGDRVIGVLLDGNGNASGPLVIRAVDPMTQVTLDVRPAVAANGRSFLLAWTTAAGVIERVIVNDQAIATHRATSPVLEDGPAYARPLAVAPFGDGYLLAWGARDVRALAVDATGQPVAGGFVSATPLVDTDPALAGGSNVLAVYVRQIASDLHPQWRVFARRIGESTPRRRAIRH